MSVIVSCPNCRGRMRAPQSALGRRIQCPHCGRSFEPTLSAQSDKPETRRRTPATKDQSLCPACKQALPAGSVFCVHCGYDLKRKRRIKSTFKPSDKKPKSGKRVRMTLEAATPNRRLQKVIWADILRTPLDAEIVLAESVVLSMWSLVWLGLLFFYWCCLYLLAFSVLAVLMVSSAIAGILRFWMLTRDVSLKWLLGFLAVLALVSLAGAFAIDLLLPPVEEPIGRRPALFTGVFLLLLFLILVLRMISFFFGRYLAICRRAALGTMMSDPDQGGLIDLGFAVGILIISALPALVIAILAALWLPADASTSMGVRAVVTGLLAVAILWDYFYFPMAASVVALKRSLNPAVVFTWIGKCMPDYLFFLLLLAPFYVLVGVLSLAFGKALLVVAGIAAVPPVLMGLVYAAVGAFFLSQYNLVVTFTALGLILRRNERRVGWLRETEALFG